MEGVMKIVWGLASESMDREAIRGNAKVSNVCEANFGTTHWMFIVHNFYMENTGLDKREASLMMGIIR